MTDEQIRQAFIKYSFQLPEEDEVSYLDFEAGYKAALASLEHAATVDKQLFMDNISYIINQSLPVGTALYRIKEKS